MPGVVVDGSDVLACYRVAREAIDRARAGDGGTLIEAKVTRLTAHSSDDQQTKYRPAEELEAQKALDPLPRFRAQLLDADVLTDEGLEAITTDIAAVVDEATTFAEGEADPDPATATWWVYHEDGPSDWVPTWKREAGGSGGGRD
jgi:2-oxoisovalerate dehydrogenase E1 component alpha subunit